MKKFIVLFLLSALPLMAQLEPGDAVPDFTLTDAISGQPVTLYDYAGKVILLNFFATW